MRSMLTGLALLTVIAGAAVPASAQGYYDRLYRGASPDPSDARPDQMQRQEEDRAAPPVASRTMINPPPTRPAGSTMTVAAVTPGSPAATPPADASAAVVRVA
jgi:hypothetical protein